MGERRFGAVRLRDELGGKQDEPVIDRDHRAVEGRPERVVGQRDPGPGRDVEPLVRHQPGLVGAGHGHDAGAVRDEASDHVEPAGAASRVHVSAAMS